jgi:hypothetical protein
MSVDATKPTNGDPVAEHAERIRAIAVVANAAEAAAGGDLRRTVRASDITETLTDAEMNQVTYCANAGAIIKTLPETGASGDSIGNWIRIHKGGAGDLTITPYGTETIADGGAGVSIANTTAAEAESAFIELECVARGVWMVSGILGTWA